MLKVLLIGAEWFWVLNIVTPDTEEVGIGFVER